MRMGMQLSAMFVLLTMSSTGQIAAGIHLVKVQFNGNTQLEGADLQKCAADLKSRTYEGPEWVGYVTEQVRLLCLQDNGYWKASVEPSTEQLPDKDGLISLSSHSTLMPVHDTVWEISHSRTTMRLPMQKLCVICSRSKMVTFSTAI